DDGKRCTFLDQQGYAWVSHCNSNNRVERNNSITIRHYGFPVPDTYTKDGQEYQLHPSNWKLHGKFTQNPVIVIEYVQSYGEHLKVVFLSSKDGSLTEINRRKGATRKVFQRARQWAESTKDTNDDYHINGRRVSELYDSILYEIISDLASQDYNQQTGEKS